MPPKKSKLNLPPPPQEILMPETESETVPLSVPMTPSQQLVHPTPSTVPEQHVALIIPESKLELLRSTIASGLNPGQFELFVEVCRRRRLDPFAGQIHPVVRGGRLVIQTAIDGYRLIAERSGKYLGQTPPMWCGTDGLWKDVWTDKQPPFASKIGVHKKGQIEPTWGIAYYATYAAPGPFWSKAPAHMLAKCGEALALKKAFPEELSGLYTDDEMEQAAQADTIVTKPVEIVMPSDEPVLLFPKDATGTGTSMSWLVTDTDGKEWVFPKLHGDMYDQIKTAIADGAPFLVKYNVELNRRVVTEIVG